MADTPEGLMLQEKGKSTVKAAEHKPFQGKGPNTVPAPVDASDNPNNPPTFKVNEFLNQEGTGLEFNKKGQLIEGRKAREVQFGADLKEQYSTFLDNHFRTLVEIQKHHPDILKSSGHAHELALMQKLVKDGKVNTDEINNFLNSEKGWILTTQLMEEQLSLKLFGLGLAASRLPEAERNNIAEEMEVWIKGQDMRGKLKGKAKELLRIKKERIKLSLEPNHAAFEAVKATSGEAEYLKAFGIDINDYDVVSRRNPKTGNIEDHIEPVPGRVVESVDPKLKQQELMGMLYTRSQFYDKLGIPGRMQDATPEQFLTQFAQSPEQTSARWQLRVQDELKPNSPDFQHADQFEKIQKYMEARRKVMMEIATEYVTVARVRKEGSNFSDRVNNKIASRENGNALESQKDNFRKQEALLHADAGVLKPEQSNLKQYKEALTRLQNARNELQKYGISDLAHVNARLQENDRKLKDITLPGSLAKQEYDLQAQYKNALNTEYDSIDPKYKGKERDAHIEAAKRRAELTIEYARDVLNNQKVELQTEINEIAKIASGIQSAEQEISTNSDIFQETNRIITSLESDLNTIKGFGISETDLQTKSVDGLLNDINANGGWPSAENDKSEHRQKLYHAILEAKSNLIDGRTAAFASPDTNYQHVRAWPVSETQLRTLDSAAIQNILNASTPPPGAFSSRPTLAQIEIAKKAAQLRFDIRVNNRNQIYGEVIDATEKDAKNQMDLGNKVNFDSEIQLLKVANTLFERRDDLNGDTDVITEKRDDFTKTQPVTSGEKGYSKTEENMQKGYLEFMEYMFHYQEREDRVEYFKNISSVIPPDTLADLLDKTLGLGKGNDIDQVLPELRARMQSGSIDARKLSAAFNDIVDQYKKQADAM